MATLKEKRTCGQRCEDFGRFVWNSDTGAMFGRTPEKWVYISLYYVAFYVIMTGLFCLAIWTLMYTLDPYTPDYQDRLTSPGVMVWPPTYIEEDVILSYNLSDKTSQRKMSNCLSNFLKPYNDTSQQSNHNCTKGEYFKQEKFEAPHHTKYSCRFTQSMLGRCSGLDDPTFGYNGTTPCVIIKMNRIINFLPNNGTGMAPHLNCTILSGHENIDMIEYFPTNGTFDLSYFPYYGKLAQPTYVNPLVAVKFHLVKEREAKIQCRVVAHNIAYQDSYEPYQGKVVFLLKALK
ncbi:potassium-transporting ATPase subunit beta-like [Oncorhynchus mykiss]|uniref:Sodium/potassium-transporting ATPase subunit beta n=3 Tax=Oncorhynchus mykiss TaxID=8022 RepID=A0A8K9X013_ONCMY|nr:potassium-transporting ATPase subunit beta [Oncorhynchus mykiss]XP_036837833.1 potassium-transporting ATPase subunit beta-like [Oncorhynchus mykiss]XP_036837834.1 potassium-transporting ATPase subunit beta-like [Oncorhynchus mykiss]